MLCDWSETDSISVNKNQIEFFGVYIKLHIRVYKKKACVILKIKKASVNLCTKSRNMAEEGNG